MVYAILIRGEEDLHDRKFWEFIRLYLRES